MNAGIMNHGEHGEVRIGEKPALFGNFRYPVVLVGGRAFPVLPVVTIHFVKH